MACEFTAHNIRLDDGSLTKPDLGATMESNPWFVSAKRVLQTVFPGDKRGYRLADLGCLEGGYSVEFARMGFQVVGIEIRDSNLAACHYVKARTNLPNLTFVKDDAWNVERYGPFDAIFCCGLLYHLDRPKAFIELLSRVCSKLVVLQTHFAVPDSAGEPSSTTKFNLSAAAEHESLLGRWYTEFHEDAQFQNREAAKWTSWDNRRSFWVMRKYLLQALSQAGFDLVMEQFDGLGARIAGAMLHGYYKTDSRGTFVGIKTG